MPVLGTPSLWFVALGGMSAYAVHLVAGFWLVPVACRTGTVVWLHALGVVTTLVAVTATVQSALVLRAASGGGENGAGAHDPHGSGGGSLPQRVGLASGKVLAGDLGRVRFMATVGLLLNVIAVLLVVTHWVPVAFFDPCL